MKKINCLILVAVLVLFSSLSVYAANMDEVRTYLTFTYTPAHPSYFIKAYVEKLTGNCNKLIITVTEFYPNGVEKIITESFLISNNSAGEYKVGNYTIYVDTKGNVQIRICEVVSYSP